MTQNLVIIFSSKSFSSKNRNNLLHLSKKLLLYDCASFCLSLAFQVPGVLYLWWYYRVDNKESILFLRSTMKC